MLRLIYLTLLTFALGCQESKPKSAIWNHLPAGSRQLIRVTPKSNSKIQVQVQAFEKDGENWKAFTELMAGTVGRNGITPPEIKKEGDGCTPAGVYPIHQMFGIPESFPTKLDYRVVTKEDYWVDDAESSEYNRWVVGEPKAKSFERMDHPLYRIGAVIEYNTDPVVAGKGSAIFFHIWSGENAPTAGCVALSEDNLDKVLRWMDKSKQPVIWIEPQTK
jgi:L,D-peptidoglycan transpeptidase YkuD (ErfK/YbiS/YcfS/YnhG family)